MKKGVFKSFVRAANVKSGSTGKNSMGGIEAHAKRVDKTSMMRRVREVEPLAWSKVGEGISAGGCDIWNAFKHHKKQSGAVERKGASLALHMLVGVSREWLEENGRDAHSPQNDRILKLIDEAKAWAESWAGEGSAIHTRFDLDERGSGNVDIVVVPTRMQRRKTRKKAATKEVLTISTRMAKEELRKSVKADNSGRAMQTSWNDWCKDRLDLRIERGRSKELTQREHIHADVLRAEGDKLRAKHQEAVEQLEVEKETARAQADKEAKAVREALFLWAKSATGPYHGLILDDLSEAERQAYKLHRMVTEMYQAALKSEKADYLFPNQRKLLFELRHSEPDPDRFVAEALVEDVTKGGVGLEAIQRISELVRRVLIRIVEGIEAHLLKYWTEQDGAHRWDVETARLCLGASELVELEDRVERAAEELSAAEPVYRRLAQRREDIETNFQVGAPNKLSAP